MCDEYIPAPSLWVWSFQRGFYGKGNYSFRSDSRNSFRPGSGNICEGKGYDPASTCLQGSKGRQATGEGISGSSFPRIALRAVNGAPVLFQTACSGAGTVV